MKTGKFMLQVMFALAASMFGAQQTERTKRIKLSQSFKSNCRYRGRIQTDSPRGFNYYPPRQAPQAKVGSRWLARKLLKQSRDGGRITRMDGSYCWQSI